MQGIKQRNKCINILRINRCFLPYTSLISKDSLALHAITLQSKNLTINNGICTYPITLGYKNKDNTLVENTCNKEISRF